MLMGANIVIRHSNQEVSAGLADTKDKKIKYKTLFKTSYCTAWKLCCFTPAAILANPTGPSSNCSLGYYKLWMGFPKLISSVILGLPFTTIALAP